MSISILRTSQEFTPEEKYRYTKDASVEKLSDHVGESITVVGFIRFQESSIDKNGEQVTHEVLSLILDDGSAIGTNSKTVQKTFDNMADIFGDDLLPRDLVIFSEKSPSTGRPYMNIRLA